LANDFIGESANPATH